MGNKWHERVEEAWKEYLDAGTPIQDPKKRKTTAIMLENEARYIHGKNINESTAWSWDAADGFVAGPMDPYDSGYYDSTTNTGDANFHKVAVPMVKRTFPELIAHEIVGVQPLTGPVGLAFALRFVGDDTYSGAGLNNQEIGYNAVDQDYSLTTPMSAAEALGSKSGDGVGDDIGLGIGEGNHIQEINMTIEKSQVEAKTRKLRSRWSLEVAQDLKAMHGLDLEEEMMDALSYEITAEIDRELMNEIRNAATTKSFNMDDDTDGRWEQEKYRGFYNMLVRQSNQIAIRTRRGAANFAVASPNLTAILESTDSFSIAPVENDINSAVTGVARVGSLGGRMTVYRDTFATGEDVVLGFKGNSPYDTGIVYLPYIQLMQMRAQMEDSFNPAVGLMSRYAIHSNIFGANLYYTQINVSGLNTL